MISFQNQDIEFVVIVSFPCQVHCYVTIWMSDGVLPVHVFGYLMDAYLFFLSYDILKVPFGGAIVPLV